MYNKPVFIAEIGWHQEDNEFNILIPDWFNQIYKDLIANMDEGTIGGAFFEYNDEPYSKVDILQQTMGVVAFAPSEVNFQENSMNFHYQFLQMIHSTSFKFGKILSNFF